MFPKGWLGADLEEEAERADQVVLHRRNGLTRVADLKNGLHRADQQIRIKEIFIAGMASTTTSGGWAGEGAPASGASSARTRRTAPEARPGFGCRDLFAASIYDKFSVGPSI
jgi:hypothetical protein